MSELHGDGLNLGGYRITGIDSVDLSSDSLVKVPVTKVVNDRIDAIILAGGNPGEFYNIKSYGGVANASVPVSGNVVTGTSCHNAINAAIAAAPVGAWVLVPAGNWLCTTPPTTISTKKLNLIILGTIYTNGNDFMTIDPPGGAPRLHNIVVLGSIVAKVNLSSNSKANYDNGTTTAQYATMTGTAFKLTTDIYGCKLRLNHIEGFQKAVEIVVGGGTGSQENTFAMDRIYMCAKGISLRSTDGSSYCDKNIFTGFDGGSCRITAEVALSIDGFSSPASNGEIYNGAFRSNEFHYLVEACVKAAVINGDVTEPLFSITHEGGTNTGIFGSPAIQCRSVAPNYVRGPKWQGQGVLGSQWMISGMGIDGTINMPVWLGPGSIAYIGNTGIIDSAGLIIMNVRASLSKSTRDALQVQIKCANLQTKVQTTATTTATSYTVLATDTVIYANRGSGATDMVLPSPATSVERTIHFRNINAGTITFSGSGLETYLSGKTIGTGNHGLTIWTEGTTWRVIAEF